MPFKFCNLYLIKFEPIPYIAVANTINQTYLLLFSSEVKFPSFINQNAPKKPTKIPIYCQTLGLFPKNATPIVNTKNGAIAFKIPAKELVISVFANVNKTDGMKFPIKPKMIR
jgi:hypothetical protein